MESPPLARYIPPNSKKRLFSGSSSSCLEPEVVEIAPPMSQRPITKSLKQKEVFHYEVIDIESIDVDEDSSDVMIIDEKFGTSKGKAIKNGSDGSCNNQSKEALTDYLFAPTGVANIGSVDEFQSSKNFAPASHNINLDCFYDDDDDEHINFYSDEFMDVDYAILGAQLDSADIPPGVEVPIPWLSDPALIKKQPPMASILPQSQPQLDAVGFPNGLDPSLSNWLSEPAQLKMKPTSIGRSSLQTQMDNASHPPGVEPTSPWLYTETAQSKKKPSTLYNSTFSSSQTQKGGLTFVPGVESSRSFRLLELSERKKKQATPSSSNYHYPKSILDKFDTMKLPPGVQPSPWGSYLPNSIKKQVDTSSLTYSGYDTQMDTVNLPPGVGPNMSWWQNSSQFMIKPSFISDPPYSDFYDPFDGAQFFPDGEEAIHLFQDPASSQEYEAAAGSSTIPSQLISSSGKDWNEDDILKKFQLFKQFDTVDDHSDHHYARCGSSVKQPPKHWAKKIQEEWRILENDLPDTIFVRVYETRMDLLRAVIVGAEGTPYHDGLFFFDVFFPGGYPSEPPHVYYHSGGLRLNPNLYQCGKVCLSLLNTWSGNKNEKWIPGVSTMLQVLVSIQALILNAKPYFNEPGYASMSGSRQKPFLKKKGKAYSEEGEKQKEIDTRLGLWMPTSTGGDDQSTMCSREYKSKNTHKIPRSPLHPMAAPKWLSLHKDETLKATPYIKWVITLQERESRERYQIFRAHHRQPPMAAARMILKNSKAPLLYSLRCRPIFAPSVANASMDHFVQTVENSNRDVVFPIGNLREKSREQLFFEGRVSTADGFWLRESPLISFRGRPAIPDDVDDYDDDDMDDSDDFDSTNISSSDDDDFDDDGK
ncbi:hypothetical protein L1049_000053 [Liquidambar formosana]|uniref:UBC core domain-containing protein n=1 Tax=Liquidambar formosana TaxID=63359 RepID=A0AAP0R7E7_LIQFO